MRVLGTMGWGADESIHFIRRLAATEGARPPQIEALISRRQLEGWLQSLRRESMEQLILDLIPFESAGSSPHNSRGRPFTPAKAMEVHARTDLAPETSEEALREGAESILSENKENQQPDTGAPDPVTPAPKRCPGRPPGSKNKPKDPNQPKPTPKKKINADSPQTAKKTPRPRAVYSVADDKKLMEIFIEQKQEGNGTDNGGWKGKAITAAVAGLAGSEIESGGAPKTDQSICDHWDYACICFGFFILSILMYHSLQLKTEFHIFKSLVEKSGWGWDDENQCVEASDEQWETLTLVDERLTSYRGKSFPIYADMLQLLEGALATGIHAYRAGKESNTVSDSSSDGESEKDATPAAKLAPKSMVVVTAVVDHQPLSSLMHMSHAMDNVTLAMKDDSDDLGKKVKKQACELVRGVEGLSLGDKAKLLLLISKDSDFAELLVNTEDDVELHTEILKLKLQE
ncbi:hypothetical protein D9758_018869 [Tetrapyrgos nigripes]|uniref:Uncharacterized protein n=1 Tax=Tetrapyrgos nigripes TaxID=182062 RepID=A0A8H5BDW2_9AGAR|nr:hypothetical protein D9758_018869 [Tetrapyrgos nigripes]